MHICYQGAHEGKDSEERDGVKESNVRQNGSRDLLVWLVGGEQHDDGEQDAYADSTEPDRRPY